MISHFLSQLQNLSTAYEIFYALATSVHFPLHFVHFPFKRFASHHLVVVVIYHFLHVSEISFLQSDPLQRAFVTCFKYTYPTQTHTNIYTYKDLILCFTCTIFSVPPSTWHPHWLRLCYICEKFLNHFAWLNISSL